MKGLMHIAAVIFSYAAISIAEAAYTTDIYYLVIAFYFALSCIFTASVACIARSRLLMLYGSVLLISAIFTSCMQFDKLYYALEWAYYDAFLNYCLIMQILEVAIIIRGGIDVIRSLLSLRNRYSSGGNSGDVRMANFI